MRSEMTGTSYRSSDVGDKTKKGEGKERETNL
jgi:hypothetical protein